MAYGIVYSSSRIYGPVEVDSRGIGQGVDGFMTVPGPDSRFFDTVDIDFDGLRGWKDPEYNIWFLYIDTLDRVGEVVDYIKKKGRLM